MGRPIAGANSAYVSHRYTRGAALAADREIAPAKHDHYSTVY